MDTLGIFESANFNASGSKTRLPFRNGCFVTNVGTLYALGDGSVPSIPAVGKRKRFVYFQNIDPT